MTEQVVVGVDGGGTSTSALVVDLTGAVRGRAVGGGASPEHNQRRTAHDKVQSTIRRALADADRDVSAVTALTAGIAGLNDETDRQWAEAFATLPDLIPDPVAVNDAVVAHAGALRGEPGIVAICGTGSIIFGVDGDGREIRNYDLDHYAEAAARHLGRRLVHRLVSGRWTDADEAFVAAVLDEWGLDDADGLRTAAVDGDLLATDESGNALDSIAPLITAAAADGVPLAEEICAAAGSEVVTGIEAVAGYLADDSTTIALSGSVLQSEYMTQYVRDRLAAANRSFAVTKAAMDPDAGAALLGLDRLGEADSATVSRLERTAADAVERA